MPPAKPIKSPASYVPAFAVGYSDATGELAIVDSAKPLPVALAGGQPLPVELAGSQPLPFVYAAAQPLPVSLDSEGPITVAAYSPPAPVALQGTSAISTVAGPFAPVADRPVVLTLSGAWSGTVQLARSVDGGVSRFPVTVGGLVWGKYTANACEPAWQEHEAGATLYLEIALVSGSLAYRLAQ